jgi:hypothetical protein
MIVGSSACHTDRSSYTHLSRFPAHSNCPDMNAYLEKPVEELNPFENYYFPDFDEQSCGHGKDYPVSNTLVKSVASVSYTSEPYLGLLMSISRRGWFKKGLRNGICLSTQVNAAVTLSTLVELPI